MAFGSVHLGGNVQTFKSSPKFDTVDMVILNIDENAYVSSPYVIIDTTAWEASGLGRRNGKYVFTYDPETGSWMRGSTAVTLESYGITAAFNVASVGPKAGDTITVNRMGEVATTDNPSPEIQVVIDLTRSGKTMEANCPLCKPSNRQQIADNLLQSLSGYGYQPFHATGAEVNPLAELGDGLTVNGIYAGMYQQDLTFDQLMVSDIGAPYEEELESEYSYEDSHERTYRRKFADIAAEFVIHSDEIAARVTREGTGDGFSWSLIETGFSVKAGNKVVFRVDKDGTYVDGTGKFTGEVSGSSFVGGSISIGSNFSVDGNGNMKAVNATLTGTLKVGGTDITAAVLRAGSQSAYDNGSNWTSAYTSTTDGGYCNIGSGYGYNFNGMTVKTYTADWVCANHIICYNDGALHPQQTISGVHTGYWCDVNESNSVYWKYPKIPTTVSVDVSVDSWVYVADAADWAVGSVSGSGSLGGKEVWAVLGH